MSSAEGGTLQKYREKSSALTDLGSEVSPDCCVQVNVGALEEGEVIGDREEEIIGDGSFPSTAEEMKAEVDEPLD